MSSDSVRYPFDLLRRIDQAFSLDDVQTLCLALGIDYDNLPGDAKAGRIRSLITLLARHDRLPDLIALLRAERPALDWPDPPPDLALFSGDPFVERAFQRLDFEPETTPVPAGPFLMGSDADTPAEAPRHTVDLPTFAIGVFPVTNGQYARFIRDTRRAATPALLWDGNRPADDTLDHPVAGVTWYEARAYCEWLSTATGRRYDLPTEAQWEKAARGPDGRRYPWGDDWLPDRCHTGDALAPVAAYPAQSVYGCHDLVGNAREWTRTAWGRQPRLPDPPFAYPWQDDLRNDPAEPSTTRRVYRGGRAADLSGYRCSARGGFPPDKPGPAGNRHGFRVVLLIGNTRETP